MYQLQINFLKESEWANTVYQPMELEKVQKLLKAYRTEWAGVHEYRIVKVG